jgi:hypothetical protein
MNATLSAHSPKFESRLTPYAELVNLPEPVALGRLHKPVPHAVLVDAIRQEAKRRDYTIEREQLAVSKTNAALFGVLDLRRTGDQADHRGTAIGFRNSTDQAFGIMAVAGCRVFVCDNLTLSGDLIAISRKNTTRLDVGDAVAMGFDRFTAHVGALEVQVARLESTVIQDGEAKRIVYDLFAARVLPVRLFDDVNRFYFDQTDERPDCAPRSLWGLHNACTRAIQDLSPIRAFGASAALGRAFELATA